MGKPVSDYKTGSNGETGFNKKPGSGYKSGLDGKPAIFDNQAGFDGEKKPTYPYRHNNKNGRIVKFHVKYKIYIGITVGKVARIAP